MHLILYKINGLWQVSKYINRKGHDKPIGQFYETYGEAEKAAKRLSCFETRIIKLDN